MVTFLTSVLQASWDILNQASLYILFGLLVGGLLRDVAPAPADGGDQLDLVARIRQSLDGGEQHETASVHRRPGRFCRHDEDAKGIHTYDLRDKF